jgi:hypothetical protein
VNRAIYVRLISVSSARGSSRFAAEVLKATLVDGIVVWISKEGPVQIEEAAKQEVLKLGKMYGCEYDEKWCYNSSRKPESFPSNKSPDLELMAQITLMNKQNEQMLLHKS